MSLSRKFMTWLRRYSTDLVVCSFMQELFSLKLTTSANSITVQKEAYIYSQLLTSTQGRESFLSILAVKCNIEDAIHV